MIERKFEITLKEYESVSELGDNEKALVTEAKIASTNAYAPYSGFMVGAAVSLSNGVIIRGNNRENAAFPSGSCAERTALNYAGANFPGEKITGIAICASNGKSFTDEPVSPCGSCRQLISEEEDRSGEKIKIILYGNNKIQVIEGVENILPLKFNKRVMKS